MVRSPFDVQLWRPRTPAPRALASPPAYVAGANSTFGYRSMFGPTSTGREAEQRAFSSHGTLFAIVDRTAFTTSTACWGLWRSAASGRREDREAVTVHAALQVWNNPNPFYTGQELRETLGQHFELTGEAWIVVTRSRVAGVPLQLWPVRPDRMYPVPSRDSYLAGYVYCDPDGTKVPLGLDEVIFMRRPSPLDPYRGMSAISTILVDIDGARAAREWNRNFFYNSAEPGGIIELETALGDEQFEELRQRWAEQHRGVGAAHRVAILEAGKWVDRKYTMKDMQFVELGTAAREAIREAYGFPKPLLGAVDDVNRANADAAETVFARWVIEPRLIRWRETLNARFLPMFGRTAAGVEFDYENPVPEDKELANATLTAKVNAAAILVRDMHAERESVVEALELPASLVFEEMPEPAPPAPMLGAGAGANAPVNVRAILADVAPGWFADVDPLAALVARADRWLPVLEGEILDLEAEEVDLEQLQQDWERELDALLAQWRGVTARQRAHLREQVVAAVQVQDAAALAELTAQVPDDDAGAELLALALLAMAALGATAIVAEAAAQGVTVEPPLDAFLRQREPAQDPEERGDRDNILPELAAGMATILAGTLAVAASREAIRQYQPGADPQQVAAAVDNHLAGLSDAYLRENLGGVLTRAQNYGRMVTLASAPSAEYYASEVLDKNTCRPCRDIHGTRLPTLDAATLAYGGSGYLFCEGRWRCRGTVVAIWSSGEGSDD